VVIDANKNALLPGERRREPGLLAHRAEAMQRAALRAAADRLGVLATCFGVLATRLGAAAERLGVPANRLGGAGSESGTW
jgi:hypothetical protein